jgi:hypothetical protein
LYEYIGLLATGIAAGKLGLDLDAVPDGIRLIKTSSIVWEVITALVGISSIIRRMCIDPADQEIEITDETLLLQD